MTLNSFQFNTTPGLRFGSGQAKDCCKEISNKLGQRILFVSDKGLMSLGLTDNTLKELQKMSSVQIFDEVEADPSQKTLLKAIEVGNKFILFTSTMLIYSTLFPLSLFLPHEDR